MVDKNESLPIVFKRVLNNLDHYNSKDKINHRINYASDNTYYKQIDKIQKIFRKLYNKI
jgi:hypothetical protein